MEQLASWPSPRTRTSGHAGLSKRDNSSRLPALEEENSSRGVDRFLKKMAVIALRLVAGERGNG